MTVWIFWKKHERWDSFYDRRKKMKELFGLKKQEKITSKKIAFIICYTLFAIGINYLGSLIAEIIVFPLYLDSILTISVAALCGLIPSLLCAFISNFILSIWTNSSILFSVCHICTALFAWCVFYAESKLNEQSGIRKTEISIDAFFWAGVWAAIANAILGNLIANLAFGSSPPMPQANIVVQCVYVAFNNQSLANNLAGIVENLIDKFLSAFISFGMYKIFIRKKSSNI